MAQLLQNYSLEQIIIFVVMLACSIKATIDFYDWAKARLDKTYSKKQEETNKEIECSKLVSEHKESFDKIFEQQKEIFAKMNELTDNINMLIKSDKDDIKAYITERHHYFCYVQHWVDDYSLDCLERRYDHYVDEGGNSYIESLMKEIRRLPKQPMQNQKQKSE